MVTRIERKYQRQQRMCRPGKLTPVEFEALDAGPKAA